MSSGIRHGLRDMNWTLEVVIVPVADVDRAKAFYAEKLGFAVDLLAQQLDAA